MPSIELSPKTETVTAVFSTRTSDGAAWDGPIAIGYYPDNRDEICMQWEDGSVYNIQCTDVDEFCRLLKSAKKQALAQEVKEP